MAPGERFELPGIAPSGFLRADHRNTDYATLAKNRRPYMLELNVHGNYFAPFPVNFYGMASNN